MDQRCWSRCVLGPHPPPLDLPDGRLLMGRQRAPANAAVIKSERRPAKEGKGRTREREKHRERKRESKPQGSHSSSRFDWTSSSSPLPHLPLSLSPLTGTERQEYCTVSDVWGGCDRVHMSSLSLFCCYSLLSLTFLISPFPFSFSLLLSCALSLSPSLNLSLSLSHPSVLSFFLVCFSKINPLPTGCVAACQ